MIFHSKTLGKVSVTVTQELFSADREWITYSVDVYKHSRPNVLLGNSSDMYCKDLPKSKTKKSRKSVRQRAIKNAIRHAETNWKILRRSIPT